MLTDCFKHIVCLLCYCVNSVCVTDIIVYTHCLNLVYFLLSFCFVTYHTYIHVYSLVSQCNAVLAVSCLKCQCNQCSVTKVWDVKCFKVNKWKMIWCYVNRNDFRMNGLYQKLFDQERIAAYNHKFSLCFILFKNNGMIA